MSHDPARWNNRSEAEAEAGLARHAALLGGAEQTAAIRRNVDRRLRERAPETERPGSGEIDPESEAYSWRPSRPWHYFELARTVAAAGQVAIGLAILLKVY